MYQEWRDYLDDRASGRPAGVGRALLASSQEVMASLETNIVTGSLAAAGISVAACFACVLLLTRAVVHTGLVLACVVWINALLASLITWSLAWPIGIIEAVALRTIFVGISVTTMLHVDRAFRDAHAGEMIRAGRLQQLRRAGRSWRSPPRPRRQGSGPQSSSSSASSSRSEAWPADLRAHGIFGASPRWSSYPPSWWCIETRLLGVSPARTGADGPRPWRWRPSRRSIFAGEGRPAWRNAGTYVERDSALDQDPAHFTLQNNRAVSLVERERDLS